MTEFKWYAGYDEEVFHCGPFDTREEAVRSIDAPGFVIEGFKEPLRLSSFFDEASFLDEAEENVPNDGDHMIFDVSYQQSVSLRTAIMAAIDQWQDDNKLVFMPPAFTQTRNLERVE